MPVISLAVAFLANFVQIPILDYEVVLPSAGEDNNGHYAIKVSNYGKAPAKHLLINLDQFGTMSRISHRSLSKAFRT